jgi:hypothetical protein
LIVVDSIVEERKRREEEIEKTSRCLEDLLSEINREREGLQLHIGKFP